MGNFSILPYEVLSNYDHTIVFQRNKVRYAVVIYLFTKIPAPKQDKEVQTNSTVTLETEQSITSKDTSGSIWLAENLLENPVI